MSSNAASKRPNQIVTRTPVRASFAGGGMFWTGITREANSVLVEQKKNTHSKLEALARMRDALSGLDEVVMDYGAQGASLLLPSV